MTRWSVGFVLDAVVLSDDRFLCLVLLPEGADVAVTFDQCQPDTPPETTLVPMWVVWDDGPSEILGDDSVPVLDVDGARMRAVERQWIMRLREHARVAAEVAEGVGLGMCGDCAANPTGHVVELQRAAGRLALSGVGSATTAGVTDWD